MLIPLLLCGCGPAKSEIEARSQLERANSRVAELSKENYEISKRLTQAQAELLAAQGKMDDLEGQIKRNLPPPDFDVSGEVFIATKGGTSYKLGAVEILAFERKEIDEWVKARADAQFEALKKIEPDLKAAKLEKADAFDIYNKVFLDDVSRYSEARQATKTAESLFNIKTEQLLKIVKVQSYILSCAFFFDQLPLSEKRTRTNSDGKFKLSLDRDKNYVLAVHAQRAVGGSAENYGWVIPVEKPSGSSVEIALTNANLSSVKGGGSLILTVDD